MSKKSENKKKGWQDFLKARHLEDYFVFMGYGHLWLIHKNAMSEVHYRKETAIRSVKTFKKHDRNKYDMIGPDGKIERGLTMDDIKRKQILLKLSGLNDGEKEEQK